MFIQRIISEQLKKYAEVFPVVAILGPRQSGKTTLARHEFAQYEYVNLERLDVMTLALADPIAFLKQFENKKGVIIDEFQNAPQLLSYIQVIVDELKKPGFFIITGSQNFLMNEAISQSLAGRVGILTLLPLSIAEIKTLPMHHVSIDQAIVQGNYPRTFESSVVSPSQHYSLYIQTYIERDVRLMINVINLSTFQRFIGLCAGRVGQLLNISSLATECGITVKTVNAWLSLLEASYIIFLLQPYHNNFNKRLTKSPKLYFYDTGIVSHILGIEDAQQLSTHYARGSLFENYVIADLFKQYYNAGKAPRISFWRDSHGHEIDCIVEKGTIAIPIEIKITMTFSKNLYSNVLKWQELAQSNQGVLIYGGDLKGKTGTMRYCPWTDFELFA